MKPYRTLPVSNRLLLGAAVLLLAACGPSPRQRIAARLGDVETYINERPDSRDRPGIGTERLHACASREIGWAEGSGGLGDHLVPGATGAVPGRFDLAVWIFAPRGLPVSSGSTG